MKIKIFTTLKATSLLCVILLLFGIFSGCAHKHKYENGVCIVCNQECSHTFSNGECGICGLECNHDYENGVCTVCSYECEHKYENGVCSECKIVCAHNYVNKVCTVCGLPKPPHYDYKAHTAESLPRINITTADGKNDWATTCRIFDMNDLTSKDDRPYYDCKISVDNCEKDYELTNVVAQIKIRGNYTANYPKKPFRIKFDKKQKMLGLNNGAKCKSWVLLADYKDMTLERNSTAFWLAKQILGSDDYYSSDFRQVEVLLNGVYWGVYLLAEQQQVNENRVNITEPEEGDTGAYIGYFIEFDGYYNFERESERFYCNYNNFARLKVRNGGYVSPPGNIGFAIKNDVYFDEGFESDCVQKIFIQKYINLLYKLCYDAVYKHEYYAFNEMKTELIPYTPVTDNPVKETVSKVIDIRSLVDTYILNEIVCDADIAWSSFLMDVDFGYGGDGLLRFEAPWDFDSALGLKDSCASGKGLFAANSNNPWLVLFINEDWFWNGIKEKWQELKEADFLNRTLDYVNGLKTINADEYGRNFDKWTFHIDGECNSMAAQVKNHEEAVAYLCNWINIRFNYLDSQW